jgi:hypothetical protein
MTEWAQIAGAAQGWTGPKILIIRAPGGTFSHIRLTDQGQVAQRDFRANPSLFLSLICGVDGKEGLTVRGEFFVESETIDTAVLGKGDKLATLDVPAPAIQKTQPRKKRTAKTAGEAFAAQFKRLPKSEQARIKSSLKEQSDRFIKEKLPGIQAAMERTRNWPPGISPTSAESPSALKEFVGITGTSKGGEVRKVEIV